MAMGRKRKKILDGEILFKYYAQMGKAGSMKKLAHWAANEHGMVNPDTGKIFTRSAIWQAMWRWVFDNLEEARGIYAGVLKSYGEFLSDDLWYRTIRRHARTCLTPLGYKKFLTAHPEYQTEELW